MEATALATTAASPRTPPPSLAAKSPSRREAWCRGWIVRVAALWLLPSSALGFQGRRHVGKQVDAGADATSNVDAANEVDERAFSLWDGMDIENASFYAAEAMGTRARQLREMPFERNVHVFGLQNTGTNLLQTMLCLNFGGRIQMFDEGSDGRDFGWQHGIWKHANLRAIQTYHPEEFAPLRENDVVPIMTVRNPLSWLTSMRHAGYELEDCFARDDWATRECLHRLPAGYFSKVGGMTYENVETIWSLWSGAYDNVTSFGFRKAIVINYEDLVQKPQATMRSVARQLGIEPPTEVRVEMTAQGPDSSGRWEALQKIRERSYLESLTHGEIRKACHRLDLDLARRHHHTDCDEISQRSK